MLFNSFEFALFFPLVTLIYFLLRGNGRTYWLLAASLLFYSAYIPGYTLILVAMILVDYCAGRLICSTGTPTRRRVYLALSIISNLGLLATFKFAGHWPLPIGLSFHTFQSLAYTVEVYKRRYPAERSLVHLALYVTFYPQLVAGPIERPQNLLRQLHQNHAFTRDNLDAGLQLMFWGLFKKVAIADRLAIVTDLIFKQHENFTGPVVALGAIAFSFQIYCDFSGYTDIAIGAARVMGIHLTPNFRRPYFATGFRDFWHRWHISLSTWFRDYVYLPLGAGPVALVIVFLLSGLWHGAAWTFLIWGSLHAFFRLAMPRLRYVVFPLATYAWIFFRADSPTQAWNMTQALVHGWLTPFPIIQTYGGFWNFAYATAGVTILLIVDWALENNWTLLPWQRIVVLNAGLISLYALWTKADRPFIYFKF